MGTPSAPVRPGCFTTIDRTTLVGRLQQPDDQEAWELVMKRYGPAVWGFARRLGLSTHDADDACQSTMAAFAGMVRGGRYERGRGRLRNLLFGIARRKIHDLLRGRIRLPAQVADDPDQTDFFGRLPSPETMSRLWEEEWCSAVYTQCLVEAKARFSEQAYASFYLRAIEDRPAREVAELLGKTPNAVDLDNHRVREYLRQIRPQIERLF